MLGRIETNQSWSWAVYGKHPSARDYFRVGRDTAMSKALSDWVERGFEQIAANGRSKDGHSSWRFWTRDARTDHLVCGLLRDSFDAVGRPYPLLVAGEGEVPDWRFNWDLLPLACESAWTRIEQTAAQLFADVKELEAQTQKAAAPTADWDALKERRRTFAQCPPPCVDTIRTRIRGLTEADPFLSLDGIPCDQFLLIDLCHRLLKAGAQALPKAVFIGSPMDHPYVAFFRRPLSASDFVRLWSLSSDDMSATRSARGT